VTRQDTDDARHRPEALHELHQLQQTPRLVTRPDAREALAHEIRQRPARLGSLLGGPHLPQALDSAALQAAHEQLGQPGPQPLKNDGRAKGGMRTAPGLGVSVWGTYDRRKGQRGAGRRDADAANCATATRTLPWYSHALHKSHRHLHRERTHPYHG